MLLNKTLRKGETFFFKLSVIKVLSICVAAEWTGIPDMIRKSNNSAERLQKSGMGLFSSLAEITSLTYKMKGQEFSLTKRPYTAAGVGSRDQVLQRTIHSKSLFDVNPHPPAHTPTPFLFSWQRVDFNCSYMPH